MLIYVYLNTLHRMLQTYLKKLYSPLFSIIKLCSMRLFLCLIFAFSFNTANSQEYSSEISTKVSSNDELAAVELLKRAKSLAHKDTLTSIKLANEVLRLAKNNNNHSISAQSHTLLAKLAQQSKETEQALDHFLKASLIYKDTNDKPNQIMSSLNYIEMLIDEKRYDQANINIEKIFPIALKYGKPLYIALILEVKGDTFYERKDYDNAIPNTSKPLNIF